MVQDDKYSDSLLAPPGESVVIHKETIVFDRHT